MNSVPSREVRLAAIVLAAGRGTRMKSPLPKVLHPVAGRSMIERVVTALNRSAAVDGVCLVVAPDHEPFAPFLAQHPDLAVAVQQERNGTAGAVASAAAVLEGAIVSPCGSGYHLCGARMRPQEVLVCAGDLPALDPDVISRFVRDCRAGGAELGVLGMDVPDPTGYGRLVVAGSGALRRIVEHRDASSQERAITLCNSGVVYGRFETLFRLLAGVGHGNDQGEYYLTDVFEAAFDQGIATHVSATSQWETLQGVNSPEQLKRAERLFPPEA